MKFGALTKFGPLSLEQSYVILLRFILKLIEITLMKNCIVLKWDVTKMTESLFIELSKRWDLDLPKNTIKNSKNSNSCFTAWIWLVRGSESFEDVFKFLITSEHNENDYLAIQCVTFRASIALFLPLLRLLLSRLQSSLNRL